MSPHHDQCHAKIADCQTIFFLEPPRNLPGNCTPLSRAPCALRHRAVGRKYPQGRQRSRSRSKQKQVRLERQDPCGTHRTWPCSTRVYASHCSGVGRPKWSVRVVSHVPSLYWPPESLRSFTSVESYWRPKKINILQVRCFPINHPRSGLRWGVMGQGCSKDGQETHDLSATKEYVPAFGPLAEMFSYAKLMKCLFCLRYSVSRQAASYSVMS